MKNNVVAENRELILATLNWAPYHGEELIQKGFLHELIEEALKRGGYSLKVEFVPWKRALEGGKKGVYDGLMGIYPTSKRTHFFSFSDKILDVEIVFFSRNDQNIAYTKLEDLVSYKIGVNRGTFYSKEFNSATYLQKEEVSKNDLNILKLVKGRIDLLVSEKLHLLHLINEKYPKLRSEIKIVSPPLIKNGLYIAISKKSPNHDSIVKNINWGLDIIKADGTFERILKEHAIAE